VWRPPWRGEEEEEVEEEEVDRTNMHFSIYIEGGRRKRR
jgi:hypothetical protein